MQENWWMSPRFHNIFWPYSYEPDLWAILRQFYETLMFKIQNEVGKYRTMKKAEEVRASSAYHPILAMSKSCQIISNARYLENPIHKTANDSVMNLNRKYCRISWVWNIGVFKSSRWIPKYLPDKAINSANCDGLVWNYNGYLQVNKYLPMPRGFVWVQTNINVIFIFKTKTWMNIIYTRVASYMRIFFDFYIWNPEVMKCW